MRFSHTGRAKQDDDATLRDDPSFNRGLKVEVEVLKGLAGGKVGELGARLHPPRHCYFDFFAKEAFEKLCGGRLLLARDLKRTAARFTAEVLRSKGCSNS